MSWETFLFNHFIQQISSTDKKIVVDKTMLFSTGEFADLLDQKGIPFTIVHSVKALLVSVNGPVNLIIVDQADSTFSIPGSIQSSFQIIRVDYESLPFNIEHGLYRSMPRGDLLKIFNYSLGFPEKLITDTHVDDILEQSLKNSANRRKQEFEQVFNQFIHHTEKNAYDDILYVGQCWGRYVFDCFQTAHPPDMNLLRDIDAKVLEIILHGGLKNLPFEMVSAFKSVERICGYLKSCNYEKKAILCFDGMGWAEWFLIKDCFVEMFDVDLIEKPIFSMIPSTTKISRSAIFSGNLNEVYQKSYPNEHKSFSENFDHAQLFKNNNPITEDSILGYKTIAKIYNLFDETAHKTILKSHNLSKNTYFHIIKQYLRQTAIFREVKILLNNGFHIYICSDHGCTAAKGNGHKIEKYLIDSYSKRGTIIRKNSFLSNDDYIRYPVPVAGNPTVILAPPGEMFDYMSACELTHGGTGVEEIVIPFIEIEEMH